MKLSAAALAFAAAELALGLIAGRYFEWGRAEALLFFAFRPWLLLILAAFLSREPWHSRIAAYAIFLILAASCETFLLLALGASSPWAEMLRGVAAGLVMVLVIDLALQSARLLSARWGAIVAALALFILLLTPFGHFFHERIILPPERGAANERPNLMLMTALPIIWGEGGAFDPESRPAASHRALEREFRVRPLDVLDEASLSSGKLLLLAQPPLLAPHELAAFDAWVRRGGRSLILTDPSLTWPSRLPLGDTRRPPPTGLLGPLLEHWGLRLEPAERRGPGASPMPTAGGKRRLTMEQPGRFASRPGMCRISPDLLVARCRIGKGEAILVADADLMRDDLWVAPGRDGDKRHNRLSDNPQIVADWLDELSGRQRERLDGEVEWLAEDADRGAALLLALLPLILGVAVILILRAKTRT
ncbi:MAG: hypothetical protein H0W74_06070 [Sphingosinicella sp.]|nr:hypothetical protein [Sphingosinicella sp.]